MVYISLTISIRLLLGFATLQLTSSTPDLKTVAGRNHYHYVPSNRSKIEYEPSVSWPGKITMLPDSMLVQSFNAQPGTKVMIRRKQPPAQQQPQHYQEQPAALQTHYQEQPASPQTPYQEQPAALLPPYQEPQKPPPAALEPSIQGPQKPPPVEPQPLNQGPRPIYSLTSAGLQLINQGPLKPPHAAPQAQELQKPPPAAPRPLNQGPLKPAHAAPQPLGLQKPPFAARRPNVRPLFSRKRPPLSLQPPYQEPAKPQLATSGQSSDPRSSSNSYTVNTPTPSGISYMPPLYPPQAQPLYSVQPSPAVEGGTPPYGGNSYGLQQQQSPPKPPSLDMNWLQPSAPPPYPLYSRPPMPNYRPGGWGGASSSYPRPPPTSDAFGYPGPYALQLSSPIPGLSLYEYNRLIGQYLDSRPLVDGRHSLGDYAAAYRYAQWHAKRDETAYALPPNRQRPMGNGLGSY